MKRICFCHHTTTITVDVQAPPYKNIWTDISMFPHLLITIVCRNKKTRPNFDAGRTAIALISSNMKAASANFVHCNCVKVNVIRRSGLQARVDGINAPVCCTQYILSHYAEFSFCDQDEFD